MGLGRGEGLTTPRYYTHGVLPWGYCCGVAWGLEGRGEGVQLCNSTPGTFPEQSCRVAELQVACVIEWCMEGLGWNYDC